MENILNQINTTRGYFLNNSFEKLISKIFINKYLYLVSFIFNWAEKSFQLIFISSNYISLSLAACYWVFLMIKKAQKIDWILLLIIVLLSCPIINVGGIKLLPIVVGLLIFLRIQITLSNKWRVLVAIPLIIEMIIKLL